MIPSYTTDDVLRILHLSEQTLRACCRAASYPSRQTRRQPHFTFQDLLILRTAKGLLEAGISVGRVRKVLASLKRQLPDDQALSHVKIYADGRRVVVWDAAGQWQPDSGQFLLNFDVDEVKGSGKVRTFVRRGVAPRTRLTAQQWYERALELEQDSPEEACHAYEEASIRRSYARISTSGCCITSRIGSIGQKRAIEKRLNIHRMKPWAILIWPECSSRKAIVKAPLKPIPPRFSGSPL